MNQLDAQQELAFIRKVIEDSRRVVAYDGKDMIFWGIIVVLGVLTMYVSFEFHLEIHTGWLWTILIGTGWAYSLWKGLAREHKRVVSFGARILGMVWLGCGVAMTIVGFAGTLSGVIKGTAIFPLMSIIIGIGYFVTCAIYADRGILFAAIAWWAGALVMFFFPGTYVLLLFAGMMIAFQIVPGSILHKKWKAEYIRPHD